MKILVFSDSHGRPNNMQKAIEYHKDAQYLLHSGDGIKDIELLKNAPDNIITANGNFEDCFFSLRKEKNYETFELCGKNFFMTHGHRYDVNFSMTRLIYSALEHNADVIIYGHTHRKHLEYISGENLPFQRENGLYIFNPGSISRPRDDVYSSYGIIEIQGNGVLLSHGIIK